MVSNRYRYAIELYREDGTCAGQVPVAMDDVPALEWTWLCGLRKGRLDLTDGTGSSAARPLWHGEVGEPYIEGFRVTILSDEDEGVSEDFSIHYFKSAAEEARADFVATNRLRKGETVRYVMLAYLNEAHASPPERTRFTAREAPPDITLYDSDLGDFINRSVLVGEVTADDIPILIPRWILDETRELALQTRNKETGGILIGRIHRDRRVPEVFVEVTAQIPAAHTVAGADRLTFTADTWTAAQAAVDLRGEGETFVAWYHDHLPLADRCRECPEEKRAVCPAAKGFFSADDRRLHRTVFPKAFATALTLTLTNGGDENDITQVLYGWRRGVIEPRGFYLLGDDPTGRRRASRASKPSNTPRAPKASNGTQKETQNADPDDSRTPTGGDRHAERQSRPRT